MGDFGAGLKHKARPRFCPEASFTSLGDAIAGRGRGRPFGSPARSSAQILPRPRRDLPEFPRRMQRPIGVAQHLPGKQHDISLVVADDLVSLGRLGDHANRCGGDIRLPSKSVRRTASDNQLQSGYRPSRHCRLMSNRSRQRRDRATGGRARPTGRCPIRLLPSRSRRLDKERAALRQGAAHRRDAFANELRAISNEPP